MSVDGGLQTMLPERREDAAYQDIVPLGRANCDSDVTVEAMQRQLQYWATAMRVQGNSLQVFSHWGP